MKNKKFNTIYKFMEYPLAMAKHTQEEFESFVEGGPMLIS